MTVHVEGLRREPKGVPFVIDTGATRTIVHALDAIRYLGATPESLEPATWPNPIQARGIGGSTLCKEMLATYSFTHDDGSLETITTRILVGELRTLSLPSLLGWDILARFHLHVDGINRRVTLSS